MFQNVIKVSLKFQIFNALFLLFADARRNASASWRKTTTRTVVCRRTWSLQPLWRTVEAMNLMTIQTDYYLHHHNNLLQQWCLLLSSIIKFPRVRLLLPITGRKNVTTTPRCDTSKWQTIQSLPQLPQQLLLLLEGGRPEEGVVFLLAMHLCRTQWCRGRVII